MLKILQAHLLRAFVVNLKIDAIYALYPESLSDKYLAVRKVFAFSDSGPWFHVLHNSKSLFYRLCCKTQRMEIQKELHICTIINTNAKEMKD